MPISEETKKWMLTQEKELKEIKGQLAELLAAGGRTQATDNLSKRIAKIEERLDEAAEEETPAETPEEDLFAEDPLGARE